MNIPGMKRLINGDNYYRSLIPYFVQQINSGIFATYTLCYIMTVCNLLYTTAYMAYYNLCFSLSHFSIAKLLESAVSINKSIDKDLVVPPSPAGLFSRAGKTATSCERSNKRHILTEA